MLDTTQCERIAVAGDWHGNTGAAAACFESAKESGCDLLVQAGDFGYWPNSRSPFLEDIPWYVKFFDLPLVWVPGNHEQFDQLDRARNGLAQFEPWQMADRVWQVPSGWMPLMGSGEVPWLFLHGGHSVDKALRTERVTWFPQECLTLTQAEQVATHLEEVGHPAVVVAHEAPAGVPFLEQRYDRSKTQPFSSWPEADLRAANNYRDMMRGFFDLCQPELATWIHGHHHVPYVDNLEKVQIVGLAHDAFGPNQQMTIIDPFGNL